MRPVFARLERLDLFLALDDHAQRRRLHAAGGQAALHLAPQHRRQVEADQIVQRAARLLRVDQVERELARIGDRFLDRVRRDLGKHDAMHGLAFEQVALAQDLVDVPRDRLAFAIQVGREIERVGLGGSLGDRVDVLLVLLDQLVGHREVVLGVDGALLRLEIAHVPVRGEDLKSLPRYLLIVLALAGDSTISRFFAIRIMFLKRSVERHCICAAEESAGNR